MTPKKKSKPTDIGTPVSKAKNSTAEGGISLGSASHSSNKKSHSNSTSKKRNAAEEMSVLRAKVGWWTAAVLLSMFHFSCND